LILEKSNGFWYCMYEGGYVYWYELDAFEFVKDLGKSIKAIIDAIVLITKVICMNWMYVYVVIYGSVILLTIFLCITHQLPQPNSPYGMS
jgi:hypothetical protein